MKVIDFRAVKKICESISYETYYEWIEDALKNKDGFVVPVKSKISQANGDYYGIMPCMNEKDNLAMVKMIGRHTLKKGELRSTMMGDLLLYEADTGVLKAVMDGEYITTLRTGAAAAQAVMMYGKKDFSVIGLIGLGNIMTVCMYVLLSIRKKEKLTVKLYQYHNQELRFMERFSQYDNIDFVLCDSYKDTIKGSEVIISAVTNVKEDFCPNNCYDEGCTVIPVMMRGFQNCDLFFDKIYTDEVDQIRGFKYFNQ
ncbi:MAG: ornithine cyclodeaminase, partial [Eubacterium sp.]|nr:ornithine cyclodeaminase [Eubacterium sp.]